MPPDERGGGATTPGSAGRRTHHHRSIAEDQHPKRNAAPRPIGRYAGASRGGPALWLGPLRCGCPKSWPCGCGEQPPSDRWIDAGAAAARHLLGIGCTPILQQHVLCALWRRGGGARALAEDLYALVAGDG
jgi:hypothetical protein